MFLKHTFKQIKNFHYWLGFVAPMDPPWADCWKHMYQLLKFVYFYSNIYYRSTTDLLLWQFMIELNADPGELRNQNQYWLVMYMHFYVAHLSALMLTLIYVRLATPPTIAHEPDDLLALSLVSLSLSPTFHCFISCLFVRGPKARRLAKKATA